MTLAITEILKSALICSQNRQFTQISKKRPGGTLRQLAGDPWPEEIFDNRDIRWLNAKVKFSIFSARHYIVGIAEVHVGSPQVFDILRNGGSHIGRS